MQNLKKSMQKWMQIAALTTLSVASSLATAHPLLDAYRAQAKAENPAFKDFSAAAGQKLYGTKTGELACSSCHTDSPLSAGKHAKTGKTIEPLAPAANAQRFTDSAKVEKWFKRNCNDVLSRACTTQEKGDFLAYVLSVK
jgi:mono/diheme cytochrome c family protein